MCAGGAYHKDREITSTTHSRCCVVSSTGACDTAACSVPGTRYHGTRYVIGLI